MSGADDAPLEAAWQTSLKAAGNTKGRTWMCDCGTENMTRDPRCKICSEPKPLQQKAPPKDGQNKYKWEVKTDTFKFDLGSKPHPDISNVRWADAQGVAKSTNGSSGVFFVATPTGAVVVKSSMSLGAEVFGTNLGAAAGLNMSKCRVVALESTEGCEMYDKLCELDKNQGGTLRSTLQTKHVVLFPFSPGVPLDSSGEDLEAMLGPAGNLSKDGLARLRALGRVLAFDLICHNTDRLPLVSDNSGNKANLLFARDSTDIVLIDNAVACVDPGKYADTLGRYLEVCSAFLKKLYADPQKASLNVLRVRDCIMETSGFDIDAMPPSSQEGGWRARMAAMEKKQGAAAAAVQNNTPGSTEIQKGLLSFLEETKINLALVQRTKAAIHPQDLVGLELVREDYFRVMLALLQTKGDMAGLSGVQFIKQALS